MSQYHYLIPEITLLTLGILSFCYGFMRRESKTVWIFSFLSILIPIILSLFYFTENEFSSGLIKIDPYRQFLKVLIYLSGLFVLILSYESFRKSSKSVEYIFLLILALCGMAIMIFANDLLILYLSLETFSLSLYILAAFYRNERFSIEAGLKYFILGTLSSILLLASIVYFYALTGSSSYDAFRLINRGEFSMLIGFIFLIASFAFKLSLSPFHAWAPDVYQGAPTPVTAFLSTAPKVAVFAALLNIFLEIHSGIKLNEFITVISILSMFVGNLLALRQKDLKRMFAYSSIAHAGYMFMAFLLPNHALLSSLIPYLVVYVFMNIGAFAFILGIKEGEKISSYFGIGKNAPLFAFSIVAILFSLTGIPPTAGFMVKFNLFKNVLASGYGELVFFALFMSILSAFYYLRIVFYIYRDTPLFQTQQNGRLNYTIAFFSALFLLTLGVFPNLILI